MGSIVVKIGNHTLQCFLFVAFEPVFGPPLFEAANDIR